MNNLPFARVIRGLSEPPYSIAPGREQPRTPTSPERIDYSPEVHGDANTFRRSNLFHTFANQYKDEIQKLSALVDEHIPDDTQAHQLKVKLKSFEEHLFDNSNYFSTKSGMMFKSARDEIKQLIQHVSSPDIPAPDKQTALDRALCEINQCADGLLANLQSANLYLTYAKGGRMGACKKSILEQVEAYARSFAQQTHGNQPNFVTNEVHLTNGYANRAIRDIFPPLTASNDDMATQLEREAAPTLAIFSDRAAVSVTPGSVLNELTDKHYETLLEVLSAHNLSIDDHIMVGDGGITPELNEALENKVMMPLKSLLTLEQKESFSVQDLAEDLDGGAISFKEAKQKIRASITHSMKDGLVELGWPDVTKQPEKIAPLKDGLSLHHEQGLHFSVKSSGSEKPRDPRIDDLTSLVLTDWPKPLMSDLAQQTIGAASSAKELIDFVSQHLTSSSSHLSPRQNNRDRALKSKLIQAVQVKVATDHRIQDALASEIEDTWSANGLKSLRPLIGMSTQAKAAYLKKIHELNLPITESVASYLADEDVFCKVPGELIAKLNDKPTLTRMLHRATLVGNGRLIDKLSSVPKSHVNEYVVNEAIPNPAITPTPFLLPSEIPPAPLTAVQVASIANNPAMVEQLLKYPRINVNQSRRKCPTALTHASLYGYTEVVEKLAADPRTDINRANNYQSGKTPLMMAFISRARNIDLVETFLRHPKLEVNKTDNEGQTTLMVAAAEQFSYAVEKLLKKPGIDVHKVDNHGRTAIIYAAGSKSKIESKLSVEQLLKVPGIDVHQKDVNGKTALKYAYQTGNSEAAAAIKRFIELERG